MTLVSKYRMIRRLSESISHIEDLPIDKFVDVIRNLPNLIGQEKLDGANMWLGLDEEGRLFTSREGKRPGTDRKYQVDDWPLVSAYNQFRAAHAALQQKEQEIKRVLRPGDTVEAEVLFGRQPNSVTYGAGGKSYIAFLRGVNGTPDTLAEHLSGTLDNQQVEVSVKVVDSTDGENLEERTDSFQFQFTKPQAIDPQHLKSAGLDGKLRKLEAFLRASSAIKGLSNMELLITPLSSISKDRRSEIKQARADALAKVQTEYKLPIKQALLDKVVRKVRSGLSDEGMSKDEDIGIEGIVLRDPKTGDQIKVVDKDIFSTINRFNQSTRQTVQSALNTVDPDAPIEARGGLLGELRIKIAEVLGNRELAKGSNVRKIIEPIKGKSPEEAIKNFAETMAGVDDHEGAKKKILALISETARTLKDKLEDFKEHQGEYRLKLKNGKEMGLSKDTVKRTLLTFAEARRNLTSLFDRVKETKSLVQLLAVLYGGHAKAVHQKEELEEGVLFENKGEIDKLEYQNKDLTQLVCAYLATVFLTMLMFHEHDTIGMRKLRDRKNMGLRRWSHDMSPLNHWGYVIWSNSKADVKKLIPKEVHAELARATKHIRKLDWKMLHMDFSFNKDLKIEWEEHRQVLQRLIDLTGLRSDRLNIMLDRAVRWPELTYDEKVKAIGRLYLFCQQFITRSSLFGRFRVIQQNMLLNATGMNNQMVIEKLLKTVANIAEDDAMAGQPVSTATTSSNVSSVPCRIGGPRQIIRRKRNPGVKALTMKFPDPRKDKA